jgi:solute:Na+ symporter, SSS family
MPLTTLDLTIVAISVVVAFAPALWLARRAGSNTAEFFASGRAAPWWLIGISMVATTFSTDTPNLVANLVRQGGIAANWVWWAYLLTGMMTVFFYARLWRRLGVLTDLEFYERRYSGPAATWVRGFRAVYLGLFFNAMIMATVTLAAAKIANVLLGWTLMKTLVIATIVNVAFAATSGLWGVLVTDFIQFGIAMAGSVTAAVYALRRPEVGGLSGLVARIDPATLGMLPDWSRWSTAAAVFVVPLSVQWWATWYPGAEPGGGSYIAQRMLAARSERDAFTGTLVFNVAHYALRPWPWILVALASMLVFPEVADIKRALPHVDSALLGDDMAYSAMLTFLPSGLMGLMLAGLLAAYVSTISTHLNWGTSYVVHDCYRRFLRPGASEPHYVLIGRLVTVGLMIAAAALTTVLGTARRSFDLMLSVGAGTGLLYLLRWFWWRINAWSEIAAMASSFALAVALFVAER